MRFTKIVRGRSHESGSGSIAGWSVTSKPLRSFPPRRAPAYAMPPPG